MSDHGEKPRHRPAPMPAGNDDLKEIVEQLVESGDLKEKVQKIVELAKLPFTTKECCQWANARTIQEKDIVAESLEDLEARGEVAYSARADVWLARLQQQESGADDVE